MRKLRGGNKIVLASDGKRYKVVKRFEQVYELQPLGLFGMFKTNRKIWIRNDKQFIFIK